MKNNIGVILISILLGLIVNSCDKKCESNLLGAVSFTKTDLNILPYIGNEQLVYLDSLGDSIKFTGNSRISLNNIYGRVYNEFPENYDCPGNYYYTEFNFTSFKRSGNDLGMRFALFISDPFLPPIKKSIDINVNYEDSIEWYFFSSFYFNSLTLIEGVNSNSSIIAFNDSLMIGSKMFHSVYILKQNTRPTGVGYLETIFYSINAGVLGFRTNKGKTWYLK